MPELPLPPYEIVMKPYGQALVDLANTRDDIICLGADLTRQTETDLFRDTIPERFINVGMAEANLMSIAGGMARAGKTVFVNTFGVFATRRCFDQIAMAVAYPNLNVKIVGFMPGLSSPGGPSHQAIDDIAMMRAMPNMTILDLADASEIGQAVKCAADCPGPVYLRLKRGEIPVVFDKGHTLEVGKANVIAQGSDVTLISSGMMMPPVLVAADVMRKAGISVAIINSPSIKPFDSATVTETVSGCKLVVTVDNHSIIGGLGSAVAEAIAEAGLGVPLRRIGVQDTFAESGSREYLFEKYGMDVANILKTTWDALGRTDALPHAPKIEMAPGTYSPV